MQSVYIQRTIQSDRPSRDQDGVAEQIAANISDLIAQRELVGLMHKHLNWVLKTYDFSDAVLMKLRRNADE
jgi:hypothetical protein